MYLDSYSLAKAALGLRDMAVRVSSIIVLGATRANREVEPVIGRLHAVYAFQRDSPNPLL